MLYHLFKYFDNVHNLPGAGMFQYISFRAAAAIIIALLIVIVFGRNIINFLRRKQIGEEIRDLGLEGQLQKKGTPTMGGVIILLAILVPVLLFGQLDNVYIQLMLVSTIWLGLIGFLDDYIKVFRHHKEGLKGRFKIVGQVGLGIIVGTTMCFSPDIVVREKRPNRSKRSTSTNTAEPSPTTSSGASSAPRAVRRPRPRFPSSRTTNSITAGSRAATAPSPGFSTSSWRSWWSRPFRTAPTSRTDSTVW